MRRAAGPEKMDVDDSAAQKPKPKPKPKPELQFYAPESYFPPCIDFDEGVDQSKKLPKTHGNLMKRLEYPSITDSQLRAASKYLKFQWTRGFPFPPIDVGTIPPNQRFLAEIFRRCTSLKICTKELIFKIMNHMCGRWGHPLLQDPDVLFKVAKSLDLLWKRSKRKISKEDLLQIPKISIKQLKARQLPDDEKGQQKRLDQVLDSFGGPIERLIELLHGRSRIVVVTTLRRLEGGVLLPNSMEILVHAWQEASDSANVTSGQREILRRSLKHFNINIIPSEKSMRAHKSELQPLIGLPVTEKPFEVILGTPPKHRRFVYAKFCFEEIIRRGFIKRVRNGLLPSSTTAVDGKLSGDGFKITKLTGELQICFQWVDVPRSQSPTESYDTILISNAKETPETVKIVCNDLLFDLAKMQGPDGTFSAIKRWHPRTPPYIDEIC